MSGLKLKFLEISQWHIPNRYHATELLLRVFEPLLDCTAPNIFLMFLHCYIVGERHRHCFVHPRVMNGYSDTLITTCISPNAHPSLELRADSHVVIFIRNQLLSHLKIDLGNSATNQEDQTVLLFCCLTANIATFISIAQRESQLPTVS